MELEWVGMVEEDGYNKTSWIFILLILLSVADQGVWVLLAETEGDVEAVLLGDLPVELPDRGHTSVSTAGVNTPSLDRLQIWSEVDSISLTCTWERGDVYTCSWNLSHICPEQCDTWTASWIFPGPADCRLTFALLQGKHLHRATLSHGTGTPSSTRPLKEANIREFLQIQRIGIYCLL